MKNEGTYIEKASKNDVIRKGYEKLKIFQVHMCKKGKVKRMDMKN